MEHPRIMGSDGRLVDTLAAVLAESGSAAHAFPGSSELLSGPDSIGNLADALHFLCVLHGRAPTLIDLVNDRTPRGAASPWLDSAADGFGRERLYLARLVVEAGPIPSTIGQPESEAAVLGQRHAFEMLAQSERSGVAIGAAIGLVLDWWSIRTVLDHAGRRLGVETLPPCQLPRIEATMALAGTLGNDAAAARAIGFGAQQILVQHHGLWDLLAARRHARAG